MIQTSANTRNVASRWVGIAATALAILAILVASIAMAVRDSDVTSSNSFIPDIPPRIHAEAFSIQEFFEASENVFEHVTIETFGNRVLGWHGPVLVDFYAEWCAPCRMQDHVLNDFLADFDKVRIVKVNVDESPELAARYDIQGLPTLLIFRDGNVAARIVGLATKRELKAVLGSERDA